MFSVGSGKCKSRRIMATFASDGVSVQLYLQLASLVAQSVKDLPAVEETRVGSLGWEDSPGEGNGNPLQYPYLENLMDRGARWVAKSWT